MGCRGHPDYVQTYNYLMVLNNSGPLMQGWVNLTAENSVSGLFSSPTFSNYVRLRMVKNLNPAYMSESLIANNGRMPELYLTENITP